MLPQLKILLALFAVFIVLFLVFRSIVIPDSFGELGHYRADALELNEDKELKYAGKQTCIDCHTDIYDIISIDVHQNLSCEVCHGPGIKHADSMEASDISKLSSREDCGRCHAYNPARPEGVIAQIDLNEHNPEMEKCIDCHNPHQVWELME
ncbi:multiheme c-type cytochrome [Bacteroidota bacterium]